MPYYEYRCTANDLTLEVRHSMDHLVRTWGELAELSGRGVGDTPADAPVERLISAPVPVAGRGDTAGPGPGAFGGCGPGCACAHEA